jgi:hypothetical protein
MANNDIYQIKVTLKHSKPPIWRRIQVRGDTRLDKLHYILQAVMGWWNAHLHQFIVGGRTYYGEPNPDFAGWGMDMKDETKVRLYQIAAGEKFKFSYEYDFGDSWEHVLLVEKLLPPEDASVYIDDRYIMASAGLLAAVNPEAARRIMLESFSMDEHAETIGV